MKRIYKFSIAITFCVCALIGLAIMSSASEWIGSWSTAMTNISLRDFANISFTAPKDITGRTVITPTASGSKVRLRFSNHYGDKELKLNSVTIAESKNPTKVASAIDVDSTAPVTFGGKKTVVIPVGEEVVSDPITFKVTALKNVAVSYYVNEGTDIKTMGLSGGYTYITTEGDKTSQEDFKISNSFSSELGEILPYLEMLGLGDILDPALSYGLVSVVPIFSGMEVLASGDAYSICIIGDSTVANKFPQYLAENIINNYNTTNVGVLGKGIIGNTLTTISEGSLGAMVYGEPLIQRFKRDCIDQAGVKYVVVKIGANDIMHPVCTNAAEGAKQPTANEIIANLQTICDMAHKAGIKVILGTITQWKGSTRDYFKALGVEGSYQRTEEEFKADWAIAKKVNKWITSASNDYHDGYFDFAEISKSPVDSAAFDSAYSDDHIHPNDTLQRKWGDEFDMSLIGISMKLSQIRLNESDLTLKVGASKTIKVVGTIPKDVENKKVTWKSSDTSVATVDSKGKVTAIKNGKATITATSTDGNKVKAKCYVTVITPVSSVSVSPAKKTIFTRDKLTLKAEILPANASDKSVTWTSSNKKVATVNSKGVVTPVSKGKVTITVTTNNGKKKAVAEITVKKRIDVSVIRMSASKKNMYVGKTLTLTAKVYPTDASYPQINWGSTDKSVAKVDQKGNVKAVGVGTCKIKAKSADNPLVYEYVTIKVFKHVSGVKLSPKAAVVAVGNTKQLKVTVSPSSAFKKTVTYSSSDKSVATVSSDGLVKAKKEGTAVVTVKTDDGGFTAQTIISVIPCVKSKSVKLNKTSKTIRVGDEYTLKETVLPSDTTNKKVVWASSDNSVARVNSKGVVTGVSKGKATIVCTTKDTGKSAKCKVTVKNVIPTKVTLSYPKLTLDPGKSTTLRATISPANATIKTVNWKSSNKSVAKVTAKGEVIAVKAGKCVITCTTVSGKKTAKCTVTVNKVKVSSIKLSAQSLTLVKGKSTTLKATVSPTNATNKNVSWKTSNQSIATVDTKGVVRGVMPGKVTITCKANDGSGVSAKCTVTIVA